MSMRVLALIGLYCVCLLAQAESSWMQRRPPGANKMAQLMTCRDGSSAIVWYRPTVGGRIVIDGMMMDGTIALKPTVAAINEKLRRRSVRDLFLIDKLCVDKDISVTFMTYRFSPTLEAHGKTIQVFRTKLSSEVVTESPTKKKLFFQGRVWSDEEKVTLRRPSALLSDWYGPFEE